MTWRDVVSDDNARKVFAALDDPRWSWRTLEGLKEATGLQPHEVLDVLGRHPQLVRIARSEKFGTIYGPVGRDQRKDESLLDKALDYLSMGRRRIS